CAWSVAPTANRPSNPKGTPMTTHDRFTATPTFDPPAESPATAARVAADWLAGIADDLDAGRPLDSAGLIIVQAKVAELVASVGQEALRGAELRFFGDDRPRFRPVGEAAKGEAGPAHGVSRP